jgi:hypothetical protein
MMAVDTRVLLLVDEDFSLRVVHLIMLCRSHCVKRLVVVPGELYKIIGNVSC